MTTPAQIIDWISYQRGVCVDRTGHYGAQAPDLVNDYAAELELKRARTATIRSNGERAVKGGAA